MLRARFGLSAQATVRCIAKVADSLKAGDKKTRRRFRRHAAQPYDARIVRFLRGKDAVSICTLTGRPCIPFACERRQRNLLQHAKGQVDLMFVRGQWLLAVTCNADEAALIGADDAIGIDMGIVDAGKSYTGAQVDDVRPHEHSCRHALQKRGRQARFQRHTNHVPSKAIVADPKRGRSLITLEDLQGMRGRVQAGGTGRQGWQTGISTNRAT